MTTDFEVLDSFVDGESVAPDDLKRALADPDGRDYFVHLWALRAIAQDDRRDVAIPSATRVAPTPARATAAPARRVPHWLTAAALVVCAAGGYVLGQRVAPAVTVPSAPASATAAGTSPTSTAPAPANNVFPAPAPTRVIQLEFQPVSTTTGGN